MKKQINKVKKVKTYEDGLKEGYRKGFMVATRDAIQIVLHAEEVALESGGSIRHELAVNQDIRING